MTVSQPTIEDLASTYVEFAHSNDESLQWSSHAITDLWLEKDWEQMWSVLQAIAALPRDINDKALALIAAGILEDLLSKNGAEYVDRIITLAASSSRFARMLTGVWRSDIEANVWERVVQFCRTVPNPIDGEYRY